MALGYTNIVDITPATDEWKICVRVIRLWTSPKGANVDEAGMIHMVFVDQKGGRIQANIKKWLIPEFKNKIKEWGIYVVYNFNVGQNAGEKIYATGHQYKIGFLRQTSVRNPGTIDIPEFGFNFTTFEDILSGVHRSNVLCDVIAEVVELGNIFRKENEADFKNRITIQLENERQVRLSCTLWGIFMDQFLEYVSGGVDGPLVIVLQFAMVKEWDGTTSISNSFFRSRLFMNEKFEVFESFLNGRNHSMIRDALKHQLSTVVTGECGTPVGDDFASVKDIKFFDQLLEMGEACRFIAVVEAYQFDQRNGWYYLGCGKCARKVIEDMGRYWCRRCDSYVKHLVPRYKLDVRVMDHTGSATFTLFENQVSVLIGKSASELKAANSECDNVYNWPIDLDVILGKEYVFKVSASPYNISHKDAAYGVIKMTSDPVVLTRFKDAVAEIINVVCVENTEADNETDYIDGLSKDIEKSSGSSMCNNTNEDVLQCTPRSVKRTAYCQVIDVDENADTQISVTKEAPLTKKRITVKMEKVE